MKALSAGAVLLLGTAGCAYYRPVAVSTTRLGPQYEETLGIVNGRSVQTYFLGIPGANEPGMQEAVADARAHAGADNLVNITVDERVTYFPFTILPLFTTVETLVRGTAIRYKEASLRPTKDLTVRPAQSTDTPPPTAKPDPAPGAL